MGGLRVIIFGYIGCRRTGFREKNIRESAVAEESVYYRSSGMGGQEYC